jgi:hypothetical protein
VLGEPVALGVIALVGVADFVGDKVPVVDHVLHAVGLAIAPVVGAVLALASASVFDLDPAITAALGVTAALATQVGRSAARPVSTAVTGGGGNPVVSLGEDGLSGVLSFTAVVWPVVAAVLALVLLVALALLWRRLRVWWSSLRTRAPT